MIHKCYFESKWLARPTRELKPCSMGASLPQLLGKNVIVQCKPFINQEEEERMKKYLQKPPFHPLEAKEATTTRVKRKSLPQDFLLSFSKKTPIGQSETPIYSPPHSRPHPMKITRFLSFTMRQFIEQFLSSEQQSTLETLIILSIRSQTAISAGIP